MKRGYGILSAFAERICLVGFSTGGTLALLLSAEQPEGLVGAVAILAPVKFRNRKLMFVPLVHSANRMTNWAASFEGVMPFLPNESENPHINYRHVPIRGLYELRCIVAEMKRSLPEVICPVQLIQGTEDHIVDPKSVEIIFELLGSNEKTIHMIETRRHGLVNQDIGDSHGAIISFLDTLGGSTLELDRKLVDTFRRR